jgi:exodeoxyribonuclease VII large subunit
MQQHIVIRSQQLFLHHFKVLEELKGNISRNAKELLSQHKQQLVFTHQRIASAAKDILYEYQQKLSLKAQMTAQSSQNMVRRRKSDMDYLAGSLKLFTAGYFKSRNLHLNHMLKSITLMSPQNILKKGYAIVKTNGKIAASTEYIKQGDDIEVILHDTILKSTVKEKIHYHGRETDL